MTDRRHSIPAERGVFFSLLCTFWSLIEAGGFGRCFAAPITFSPSRRYWRHSFSDPGQILTAPEPIARAPTMLSNSSPSVRLCVVIFALRKLQTDMHFSNNIQQKVHSMCTTTSSVILICLLSMKTEYQYFVCNKTYTRSLFYLLECQLMLCFEDIIQHILVILLLPSDSSCCRCIQQHPYSNNNNNDNK